MLGKLLKHELRATAHTMLPLFGLLLIVAGLTNVAIRGMNGKDVPTVLGILFVILLILFTVGVMAVGMVTVFAMIQRFRNNLLRDEGYIMHTLPVSIHAQIWAKVIVSGLWYTLASAAFVLASLIVAADAEMIKDMFTIFKELLKALGDIKNVEMLAEILGIVILSNIFLSLMIYASLAMGHSLASRKMLWSVLAFVGLIFAVSLISSGLGNMLNHLTDLIRFKLYEASFMEGWRILCALGAGFLVFFSGIFYGITVWFMKHKLNLE